MVAGGIRTSPEEPPPAPTIPAPRLAIVAKGNDGSAKIPRGFGASSTSVIFDDNLLDLPGAISRPLQRYKSPERAITAGSMGTSSFTGSRTLTTKWRPRGPPITVMQNFEGVVLSAKNLPKIGSRPFARCNAYVIVKGIRSNNNYVDITKTKVRHGDVTPSWNHAFNFDCPEEWAFNELVGLKFLVYHASDGKGGSLGANDFLGGADVDLSLIRSGCKLEAELELSAMRFRGMPKNLTKMKRPRLTIEVTPFRAKIVRPLAKPDQVRATSDFYTRVENLSICVEKAKRLMSPARPGLINPMCIVRIVNIAGQVKELWQTREIAQTRDPLWDEWFECDFSAEPTEEPVLIGFEVWDTETVGDEVVIGTHLGGNIFPLHNLTRETQRLKLDLYPECHRMDLMVDQEGNTQKKFEVRGSKKAKQHLAIETDMAPQKESYLRNLCSGWLPRRDRHGQSLTVEISLRRTEESMPHGDLLTNELDIADIDDCQKVLEAWAFSNSLFRPPPELRNFEKGFGGVTLKGYSRVMFIAGVIKGCSGLISPDGRDRADPYCMMEACAKDGSREFLHRTRVVQDSFNPDFTETFYRELPQDLVDAQRIMLTIYDHRQGGDVVLGVASLDIDGLCTAEEFYEDIPLMGMKRPQFAKESQRQDTPFRRPCAITLQVFVERRVEPRIVGTTVLKKETSTRHKLSRIPVMGYTNPAADVIREDRKTPGKVWDMYLFNELAASRAEKKMNGQDAKEHIAWTTVPKYRQDILIEQRKQEELRKEILAQLDIEHPEERTPVNRSMEELIQSKLLIKDPNEGWMLPDVPAISRKGRQKITSTVSGPTKSASAPPPKSRGLPAIERSSSGATASAADITAEASMPSGSAVQSPTLLESRRRFEGPPEFLPSISSGPRSAALALGSRTSPMAMSRVKPMHD